jgi:DNA ligase-1
MMMKFSAVAERFAAIEKLSSRLEITAALSGLLKNANANEVGIICKLSMGQLYPPHVGTQFSIAAKNMIKIIASLQGVEEESVLNRFNEVGDLGLVAEEKHAVAVSDLTLQEVYEALEALEQLHGTGSVEEKSARLQELLGSLDALSVRYVVRMVLGKLRLGFSDMTLLDALSWMLVGSKAFKDKLEYAYNKCAETLLLLRALPRSRARRGLIPCMCRSAFPYGRPQRNDCRRRKRSLKSWDIA